MRTKDEILKSARKDIRDKQYSMKGPLWLELRKLEVFIDIRDILTHAVKVLLGIYDSMVMDK